MLKLLLFGTGSGCLDLLSLIDKNETEIVAFADHDLTKHGTVMEGKPIIRPCDIVKFTFDFILITCAQSEGIINELESYGVERQHVLLFSRQFDRDTYNKINCDLKQLAQITGNQFEPYSLSHMGNLGRERLIPVSKPGADYIRLSSLELAAYEISLHQLEGSIAELGVYQGDFAKEMNALFPNRKLYLFDTFCGFDKNDVMMEMSNDFSYSDVSHFSSTSVNTVLSKMIRPEDCIIRKGYFPDTCEGIEDNFVFVSIDADLFNPILAGLEYFYPRLLKGGFIFVHDHNNSRYRGVQKAVNKFCTAHNTSFFPLSDSGGTAVFIK